MTPEPGAKIGGGHWNRSWAGDLDRGPGTEQVAQSLPQMPPKKGVGEVSWFLPSDLQPAPPIGQGWQETG